MKEYYVYGHYTKGTKELFYIGAGCGERAVSPKSRNLVWYELAKNGFDVKIMLVGFKDKAMAVKYEEILQRLHKPRACMWYGYGAGQKRSDDHRANIAESMVGNTHLLGKKFSKETRKKMSTAKRGVKHPTSMCPHCSKVGGASPMSRWHFDNCKSR